MPFLASIDNSSGTFPWSLLILVSFLLIVEIALLLKGKDDYITRGVKHFHGILLHIAGEFAVNNKREVAKKICAYALALVIAVHLCIVIYFGAHIVLTHGKSLTPIIQILLAALFFLPFVFITQYANKYYIAWYIKK